MLVQLLTFIGVSMIVICTPGPDTALTVRNALTGGGRGGVVTAAGVAAGQAVWTVATSAGIAGVLVASEPAFLAVKVVGAAYLCWLGLTSLYRAWRGYEPAAVQPGRKLGPGTAFRQGLVSNLANPKMAAFFLSLLPQFAPSGGFGGLLAFGLIFCMLTFGWLAAYSVAIHRMRRLFARARVRRILDSVTGTVLLAFGTRLAFERGP